MREIKFRAWDSDHKEFEYLDFSDLSSMADFWSNGGTVEYVDFAGKYQQFTGLKDKNGKEIYEGDIVKLTYDVGDSRISEIYFDYRGVRVKEYSGMSPIRGRSEVIGNIYENKDLL